MPLVAAGHKRTGACPTFDRPVLQRDGTLLRPPLAGGRLSSQAAVAIPGGGAVCGNGIIELTNRGNLQVRGLRTAAMGPITDHLRHLGLGHPDAALVTISPFANSDEHHVRARVVGALHDLLADGIELSPKFVVHVDDAAGTTSSRRAEAVLALTGAGVRVDIDQLGTTTTSAADAVDLVVALAEACRRVAPDARVADILQACGPGWLHAVLPADLAPLAVGSSRRGRTPGVGRYLGPCGERLLLAGARFGRTDAGALSALSVHHDELRITPWRSIAFTEPANPASRLLLEESLEAIGLIVDPADAAADVISCIGAAGCWQTEADTWVEAERVVASRANDPQAQRGPIHISGCDKRCATRGPMAVTYVGRTDGSGFDQVVG